MDQVVGFVHNYFLYFSILTILVLIIKTVWIIKNRGLNLPAFITSLFRIYNKVEFNNSRNRKRVGYMYFNNLSNYYLYFYLFILLLNYIISLGQK